MKTKSNKTKPIAGSKTGDSTANHEQIATCARLIWEQEGRPVGHELEHWLKAEAQLRQTHPLKGDA